MIATLVWDGTLHTVTANSWIWSTQMYHTAFGGNWGNALPRKKTYRDRTAVMVDHKLLSEGRERSFRYCPGVLYWQWYRWLPAVIPNGGASRVIRLICWAIYFLLKFRWNYPYSAKLPSISTTFVHFKHPPDLSLHLNTGLSQGCGISIAFAIGIRSLGYIIYGLLKLGSRNALLHGDTLVQQAAHAPLWTALEMRWDEMRRDKTRQDKIR